MRVEGYEISVDSFWDLFACDEVKWIKREIRYFFNTNRFIINEEAKRLALKVASNANKAKYCIRVEQLKPRHIALNIISNVAYDGVYYAPVSFGLLSLVGEQYLELYIKVSNLSVDYGYIEREEMQRQVDELRESIKR